MSSRIVVAVTWPQRLHLMSIVMLLLMLEIKKLVEDKQTSPSHAQCIICIHSQPPLCTAKLVAEGCQSAGGNAERGGAEC